jgi:thymidylate synthase ThyX
MSMSIVVELQDFWGDDWKVGHAAWTSTLDEERSSQKTEEELKHLIQQTLIPHDHKSPLEKVWYEFYIKCPIFVERQLDKYRMSIQSQGLEIEYLDGSFGRLGISQNELSGRYRTIPDEYYDLPQDFLNITNAIWSMDPANSFGSFYNHLMDYQSKFYRDNLDTAKKAEKSGVISNADYKRFREVIRGVLGTGYMTQMKIMVNLVGLTHIWQQRLSPAAQPEVRDVAQGMLKAVVECGNAPYTLEALVEKHGWQEWLR